jgi:hypothetical protein
MGFVSVLLKSAAWGVGVGLATDWASKQALGQTEEQARVLGEAAGLGTFIGMTIAKGMSEGYFSGGAEYATTWGVGAGITVGLVYAYEYYKTKEEREITFECVAWEPPKGGQDCAECGEEGLPCSEYRCRSLGRACELLNPGTDEEICAWRNRNDVTPPEIRPWDEILQEEYKYKPETRISPPDRGVEIVGRETEGCVQPFTPLRFGVNLDEPARCKIDLERKEDYEEMQYHFGGSSLAKYNHSQIMSIPAMNASEEAPVIETGENMTMYVRCEDANGNSNKGNFVFQFCVDQGPDATAPLIIPSISDNSPFAHGLTSIDFNIETNELAKCRWSHLDQSYDKMENDFTCPDDIKNFNTRGFYDCKTDLTGLEDNTENVFYIKCEDSAGNVNRESVKRTFVGTQSLGIDWAKPNNVAIRDNTDSVKVTFEAKTIGGYNEGEAFCEYKPTEGGDYIRFFYETGEMTYQHSQDLWFDAGGDYNYTIQCMDFGGNIDTKNITFTVVRDISIPAVVRTYYEEGRLKIVTSEDGECVYSNDDCRYEFDDGIAMLTPQAIQNTHFTDWDVAKIFYIKCKDSFENQPSIDRCSATVGFN